MTEIAPAVDVHRGPTLDRERLVDCYADGVAAVRRVASRYTRADWGAATPCPGWTAQDLAGHLRATAVEATESADSHSISMLLTEEELAEHNAKQIAGLPASDGPGHVAEFVNSATAYVGLARRVWQRPSYRYREQLWTVGHNVGVLAVEWHVHAWDLAVAIGQEHRPADPVALATAFCEGMAYLQIGAGEPWAAVLKAAGRHVPASPRRGRGITSSLLDRAGHAIEDVFVVVLDDGERMRRRLP